MKKLTTTTVVAATIAAGAIVGTTVAAPEAQAQVFDGKYTWIHSGGGQKSRAAVTVRRGVLFGPNYRYRIRSTPRGGVINAQSMKWVLNRYGNGYRGPTTYRSPWTGQVLPYGSSALIPR
ncbi:MAG: hypothetical protein QM774_06775 [Gordonia sp. (in: high G+C Gram-positive bacteria)]|uniref:hypothetical protein n=1 Tax=Gordonia sp. (in: high G+C Gram-positive bacteria) TaxID=84139 RepID=UPI0039E241EE